MNLKTLLHIGIHISLNFWMSNSDFLAFDTETTVQKAQKFLDLYEQQFRVYSNQKEKAYWDYDTNMTDYNEQKLEEAKKKFNGFLSDSSRYASTFDLNALTDQAMRIRIENLAKKSTTNTASNKSKEERLRVTLEQIFSTAKVCAYDPQTKGPLGADCNLSLDPDLTDLMGKSRDYDELAYYWKTWRDASGKPARQPYTEFVHEMQKTRGTNNMKAYWFYGFNDDNILDKMEKLWEQMEPLYKQLHAYVRRRLINKYGADKINATGPIPAHLLGNMWAQEWTNIYDYVKPFPMDVDLTEKLREQNYTIWRMMHLAEDFYTSMGLPAMTPQFWKNSILERPQDGRNISCHPTSFDFGDKEDYRIRMCSEINLLFLFTCFHEMGHIEYFMLYSDLPSLYREGANSAFHEAVGDTSMMALMTPSYLKRVGLINDTINNNVSPSENEINLLLQLAMLKVAALPFLLLVDLWRIKVFQGEIAESELNQKWWEYRIKYQGVSAPFPRTEEDFDPPAKHHIAYNSVYISYFMSRILQFQFYKSMCEASNHQGPLYRCDIYGSKAAGDRLRQGLSLGSSQPWPKVLEILTGNKTDQMDAGPILEYFEPFYEFLKKENKDEYIGWDYGKNEQQVHEEKVIVTLQEE